MTPCSIWIRQAPHSVAPMSMSPSRSRLQQAPAGAERGPEAIARQAVGAPHARAAAVDELDVELQDVAQQFEPGRADVQGAEMAGLVVADAACSGSRGSRQLAAGVEAEQILADVHRVGGDQLGVEVFGQLDVFLRGA